MSGAPGGDMGGGGGDMGGGGAGGGMEASASSSVANIKEFGGKVLKKRSREKISKYQDKLFRTKEKQNEASGYIRDDKGRIAFTGPERTLLKELASSVRRGEIRHNLQAQFPVQALGSEYSIDFAMPDIKLGIEVDGSLFHSTDEQIANDKKRDSKLAQLGWTILRFTDKEVENKARQVIESVIKYQIQKENFMKQK
jgi:very-short-patch-repair endonuclease